MPTMRYNVLEKTRVWVEIRDRKEGYDEQGSIARKYALFIIQSETMGWPKTQVVQLTEWVDYSQVTALEVLAMSLSKQVAETNNSLASK